MEVKLSSEINFVEFVVDQIEDAGSITYRKMFGEYTLYVDGKILGLVCDNQFFIKPTAGGRAFLGDVVEAPPYPGAKPMFLIEELLEDGGRLSDLVRITAGELPEPKPKKKK